LALFSSSISGIDGRFEGSQLQRRRERTVKAAVAIGGFIIMVGMIMLGTSALAFFSIFDSSLFFIEDIQVVFVWMLLFLGVADLVAGVILLVR